MIIGIPSLEIGSVGSPVVPASGLATLDNRLLHVHASKSVLAEVSGKIATASMVSGATASSATQGTASKRPTLVASATPAGGPAIRFTAASSTEMRGTFPAGFTNCTLFAVVRVRASGQHGVYQSSDSSAVNDGCHLFVEASTWKSRRMKSLNSTVGELGFSANAWVVMSAVYDVSAPRHAIWRNGNAGAVDTSTADTLDPATGYVIGALFGPTYPGDVDIAEICVVAGAMTDADRIDAQELAGDEHGITVV